MLPLAVLVALLALAPSAHAATGPCRVDVAGGPTCKVVTGKVTHVADGDGLYVDVHGDGTRRAVLVRMTGLNATELTRYSHTPSRRRGACHAKPAAAALEGLVRRARGRVRLAAQDLRQTDLGRRVRRHVAVRIGGTWVDAAAVLLARGHALWLPNTGEWAWNALHHEHAVRAAAAGRRLYDPTACGAGPSPGAALALRVNYDADGNDSANVNGEYFQIRNDGAADVPLGGWWVRDSALRRFTFPTGAVVRARSSVLVRVGRGVHSATTFHWGQPGPVFENPTYDARALGDGGYLFDPRGALRAFHIYP
jgi:micrococcal nuclease